MASMYAGGGTDTLADEMFPSCVEQALAGAQVESYTFSADDNDASNGGTTFHLSRV